MREKKEQEEHPMKRIKIFDTTLRDGEHFGRAKLYSVMMKYVVPVVMLILFLTSTGLGSLIFGGR